MSRNWLIPILIFVVVFVLSSQGLRGGPEVSVREAVALLKSDPRPLLIDLRERTAYDQGHLPGAISVPMVEFKGRVASLKLLKMDVLVLYGADDARAREATRHLYDNGYQGALTLSGGFEGWRAAGLAVEKSPLAK